MADIQKRLEFMHAQRTLEWQVARRLMPLGGSFLDYGTGTGIMASLAEKDFAAVAGIDIASSNYRRWTIRPVTIYDGNTIPFPDGFFDVVFSSHAIYFGDPVRVHAQIARVLRPTGVAVHIVPTAAARIVAAGVHFLTLPFRIARALTQTFRSRRAGGSVDTEERSDGHARNAFQRLAPASLNPPMSFIEEIGRFRLQAWRRRFQSLGWSIVAEASADTFGSSRQLLRAKFPQPLRALCARIFGSHSHVFVLRFSPGSAVRQITGTINEQEPGVTPAKPLRG